MKRREFIALLGGAAAAWPLAARAQELGRTYRIGLLVGALDSPVMAPGYPALRDELRKRGFIEGRNLIVEVRSIGQEPQRLFADMADLVYSNVD
jgi:putative ABC transport system substrate-binding protein